MASLLDLDTEVNCQLSKILSLSDNQISTSFNTDYCQTGNTTSCQDFSDSPGSHTEMPTSRFTPDRCSMGGKNASPAQHAVNDSNPRKDASPESFTSARPVRYRFNKGKTYSDLHPRSSGSSSHFSPPLTPDSHSNSCAPSRLSHRDIAALHSNPDLSPPQTASLVSGFNASTSIPQRQLDSGYAYAVHRGNGAYTRLVPADRIPQMVGLPKVQGPEGLIVLPELRGGVYMNVSIYS